LPADCPDVLPTLELLASLTAAEAADLESPN
jgi:hypothetical protein